MKESTSERFGKRWYYKGKHKDSCYRVCILCITVGVMWGFLFGPFGTFGRSRANIDVIERGRKFVPMRLLAG